MTGDFSQNMTRKESVLKRREKLKVYKMDVFFK